MERTSLPVQIRTVLGKKVKQLRKAGIVPGHIYGYETDPLNVSIDRMLLHDLLKKSGEAGLIDLLLDDKKHPVLIANIQRHAVSDDYLNVDFHKVNLKEKVTVTIPIVLEGEATAVANNVGILEQPLSEIAIEALPTDLIEHVIINVEAVTLNEVDDALYVKDLVVPATITILNDPDEMVVKVGTLITEEMAEALAAEEKAAQESETAQAGEEAEGDKGQPQKSEESDIEPKSDE